MFVGSVKVSDCLSKLCGVLCVPPPDLIYDFLPGLDVLVGASLSSRIIDEPFQRGFSPFKLRLAPPGNTGAGAIARAIVVAVTPATASSTSSCHAVLCYTGRRTLAGRRC
jgi:hypothetical protein